MINYLIKLIQKYLHIHFYNLILLNLNLVQLFLMLILNDIYHHELIFFLISMDHIHRVHNRLLIFALLNLTQVIQLQSLRSVSFPLMNLIRFAHSPLVNLTHFIESHLLSSITFAYLNLIRFAHSWSLRSILFTSLNLIRFAQS